jgi:hypothetical protein
MGSSTILPLDERINGVIHDSPDILYRLTKLETPEDQPIEIVSELPAAVDPDIIIGYVQRWVEIQHYFNKDVRIYAWSYSTESEKYVMGCVQNMSHVFVTVLPMYLKENKQYA